MARLVLRDTLAMRFSGDELEKAVKKLDAQRKAVQIALWACLLGVLFLELKLPEVVISNAALAVELLPGVSVRIIVYLVVAWLLTDRLRERFGYGLALGIGLVQVVLRLIALPQAMAAGWLPLTETIVLAVLHGVLVALAVRVSLAYPADSRRWPWIVGAGLSVIFIVGVPELIARLTGAGAPTPVEEEVRLPAVATADLRNASRTLAACALKYRDEHPAEGLPADSTVFKNACVVGTPLAQATGFDIRYQPTADSTGAATFELQFRQDATPEMLPGRFVAGPDGEVRRATRVKPAANRTPAAN